MIYHHHHRPKTVVAVPLIAIVQLQTDAPFYQVIALTRLQMLVCRYLRSIFHQKFVLKMPVNTLLFLEDHNFAV